MHDVYIYNKYVYYIFICISIFNYIHGENSDHLKMTMSFDSFKFEANQTSWVVIHKCCVYTSSGVCPIICLEFGSAHSSPFEPGNLAPTMVVGFTVL